MFARRGQSVRPRAGRRPRGGTARSSRIKPRLRFQKVKIGRRDGRNGGTRTPPETGGAKKLATRLISNSLKSRPGMDKLELDRPKSRMGDRGRPRLPPSAFRPRSSDLIQASCWAFSAFCSSPCCSSTCSGTTTTLTVAVRSSAKRRVTLWVPSCLICSGSLTISSATSKL